MDNRKNGHRPVTYGRDGRDKPDDPLVTKEDIFEFIAICGMDGAFHKI